MKKPSSFVRNFVPPQVYYYEGYKFLLDRDSNPVFVGDYVECKSSGYESIHEGERRRVRRIEQGCFVLRNNISPAGTSPYRPENFVIVGRHHKYHKDVVKLRRHQLGIIGTETGRFAHDTTENMKMSGVLHIAVAIPEDETYADLCGRVMGAGNVLPKMIWDTSKTSLQGKVRDRIRANPDEKWLILTGTTIAEMSAPPIVFRQA